MNVGASELAVGQSTSVGKVGRTIYFDTLVGPKVHDTGVPALEDIVLSLLEGGWFSVVCNFRVINLSQLVSILDVSFILYGEEVKWLALSSLSSLSSNRQQLDSTQIILHVISVIALEVRWVIPGVLNRLEFSTFGPFVEALSILQLFVSVPWDKHLTVLCSSDAGWISIKTSLALSSNLADHLINVA